MSTDLELLKQLIDYQGKLWGDLKGIFVPLLRAYFLLTGRPSLYDSVQVRDVEYKKGWDSDCAYVSFARYDGREKYYISVWHHEGAYMVFDGRIDDFGTEAEREITNHPTGEGVGKNRCILDFLYCDGLYDSFVEIRNWITYEYIRDCLGLDDYDNFDRKFKGFAVFKKHLAAIEADANR